MVTVPAYYGSLKWLFWLAAIVLFVLFILAAAGSLTLAHPLVLLGSGLLSLTLALAPIAP